MSEDIALSEDLEALKALDSTARDFLISVLSSIRLQVDNIIACLIPEPDKVVDSNVQKTT